jgi:hypothetical protein
LGRPGCWRKQTTSGMHERIPPRFFVNQHATLLGGN